MSRSRKQQTRRQYVRSSQRDWRIWPGQAIFRWLGVCLLALGISYLFWGPLWQGGGLIGGDLYPYYMPQKQYYADALKSGLIPLWNDVVGFGYPQLAESQTGVYYPPHLLLYSMFAVNRAYVIGQLAHYFLAFLGTYLVARQLGLKWSGALLAAIVLVFGWFPARICLEWAIIGGAWFVWVLWAAIAFLQTKQRRYLFLTSMILGLYLLAGHYNLAFMALLVLLPMPWIVPVRLKGVQPPVHFVDHSAATSAVSSEVNPLKTSRPSSRDLAQLWGAVALGFALAACQLVPTWELKKTSQRQDVNQAFVPTEGHLPFVAVSQLWNPYGWYAGEKTFDELLAHRFGAVASMTNQAEAQFYAGLIPLGLVILAICVPHWRRNLVVGPVWKWLIVAVIGIVLASGWPTYWFSWVPGIGFFRGPGRYSLISMFVIAIIAGASLDVLIQSLSRFRIARFALVAVIVTVTTFDLYAASRRYDWSPQTLGGRQVFYALMLDDVPVNHLAESSLRTFFTERQGHVRLVAPGANIPSMLNVPSLPTYLGIGPEIYETDAVRFDFKLSDPEMVTETQARLHEFGVTHVLTEFPVDTTIWKLKDLGLVGDRFLNSSLARREPYYFYEVIDSPGRVSFLNRPDVNQILSVSSTPHRIEIEVVANEKDTLRIRDLQYPGWELVSPTAQTMNHEESLFRDAEILPAEEPVQVVWEYRPKSVRTGWLITICAGGLLLLGGAIAFRWRLQFGKKPSEPATFPTSA